MWTATDKFRRCQTSMCRVPLVHDTLAVYLFDVNNKKERVKYYCPECIAKLTTPYIFYRQPQVTFFLDFRKTRNTYFRLLVDPALRRYLFNLHLLNRVQQRLLHLLIGTYFLVIAVNVNVMILQEEAGPHMHDGSATNVIF
jgi:hypothetical protein